MKVHPFFPSTINENYCIQEPNGRLCRQEPNNEVHKRIQNDRRPFARLISVEVFVNKGPQPWSGIHYATVTWQAENNGSWYSGWFAPHNSCAEFRRCHLLDSWSIEQAAAHLAMLADRRYTEQQLIEIGITNN